MERDGWPRCPVIYEIYPRSFRDSSGSGVGDLRGLLEKMDYIAALGVDAIWISNHGGRQFDAAPATIEVLPDIRSVTDLPLILDGGVSGGLDILRAMAFGADFVMLGRAWHYALAALGPRGPEHLQHILRADLEANMGQLGLARVQDAASRLIAPE